MEEKNFIIQHPSFKFSLAKAPAAAHILTLAFTATQKPPRSQTTTDNQKPNIAFST
jgi:hypothetical protein